jgi:hypothetical protein
MTEKTVVRTMELPNGRDWLWFADLNVVGLAPHLDAAGVERAYAEMTAWWRRSCLRLVPDTENFAGVPTEPFALPRQRATLPQATG